MKHEREIYALENFIDIMKSCRQQLVTDIFDNEPDLYYYLFADNENLRRQYKKRYELKWLKKHLDECENIVRQTNLELATRRELLKIFLHRYLNFVEAWDYKPKDVTFLEARIKSLDALIQTEQQLIKEFNQLEVSLFTEKKFLDKLIEEAKKS